MREGAPGGEGVSGPETRALFATRRWLLPMLTGLLVLVTVVSAVTRWTQLSSVEHGAVAVAAGLVVAGAVMGRRPAWLMLSLAGPFVLVLTALLAPVGSPPWIPMPNVITYSLGFATLMVSRWLGAVLVPVAPAVLAMLWARQPSNIISGPLQLAGGWITVAQVAATCLAVWWAWWTLRDRALFADRDFLDRQRNAESSLAQQERARLWRETAVRIHESVLNSIRYVLTSDTIDRERLARQLDAPSAAPEGGAAQATTIDQLLSEVLADPIASALVRIPESRVRGSLSPEVFAACRAALVEIAHNAQRHGGATSLALGFEVDGAGLLTVVAVDDGAGLPSRVQPGIGTSTLLATDLRDVGGSAAIGPAPGGGTQVVITVPATVESSGRSRRASWQLFDQGRALISWPLAAACAVGVAYYFLLDPFRGLDRTGGFHYWLSIVCGVTASGLAVLIAGRRRRLPPLLGVVLVLVPAFVPWFLRTAEYGCGDAANLAAVLNIAGFAVIAIAVWGGLLPGVVGVLTWTAGIAIVTTHVPADCRQYVTLALANSLLIIPIALLASWVGVASGRRADERVQQVRRQELVEQSRAQTALDLNVELFDAVTEASSVLADLAAGRPLDHDVRRHLEAVDARIRVAIQVDATAAGAMARLARTAVDEAFAAGRPVEVRAIVGSTDHEPLPDQVGAAVTSALVACVGLQPQLQVFTDGTYDYLSAVIDDAGVQASGLPPGHAVSFGSTVVQILAEDDDDPTASSSRPHRFSLLVSRPITTVAVP